MNLRNVGNNGEQEAVKYLQSLGYKILETNYYTHFGEIDIIARDSEYLCFIEVKYRNKITDGYPEDAVDIRKAKKISRSALQYLNMCSMPDTTPCRFDVVTILGGEINLYKNAFDFVI